MTSSTINLAPAAAKPAIERLVPNVQRPLSVAVVGGSLSGPLTALLLSHAGCDVAIYEAGATANPQGGSVIGLDYHALDVLDGAGIDRGEYLAPRMSATIWRAALTPLADLWQTDTYPGRFVTWRGLHQALIRRLPIGMLHTGFRVTQLDRVGSPALPRLTFAVNHPPVTADLVVFADGRNSVGRRNLAPRRSRTYAGYCAFRGQGPDRTPPLEDFLRLDPDRGLPAQFNICPAPSGSDWLYYLDTPTEVFAEWFGAPPLACTFVPPARFGWDAQSFVDSHAAYQLPNKLAELVRSTTTRDAMPVIDTEPPTCAQWWFGGGGVVLVGDALAPARAHASAAANTAILQARHLATAITAHIRDGADLRAALFGWQRQILPSARTAVQRGRKIGKRLGLGTSTAGN